MPWPFVDMPTAPPLDPAEQTRIATEAQAKMSPRRRDAIRATDSTIESILGMIGVGDETKANVGGQMMMAMLPGKSFIRNPLMRAAHLEKLIASAPNAATRTAMAAAAKKHPRLTAHYTEANALPLAKTDTTASVDLMQNHPEVRASIAFNPRLDSPSELGQTIAHESGHMADAIRTADRARHAGIEETPGALFTELYKRAETQAGGYARNPFEIRARTGEEAYRTDRAPGRFAAARDKARDPSEGMLNVARALNNDSAMEKVLMHQARTMPSVRRVQDPGTLGDLLRQLDPRFSAK